MRAQGEGQLCAGSARLAGVAYAVAVLGQGVGVDMIRRVLCEHGPDSAAAAPVSVGFVDPGPAPPCTT